MTTAHIVCKRRAGESERTVCDIQAEAKPPPTTHQDTDRVENEQQTQLHAPTVKINSCNDIEI